MFRNGLHPKITFRQLSYLWYTGFFLFSDLVILIDHCRSLYPSVLIRRCRSQEPLYFCLVLSSCLRVNFHMVLAFVLVKLVMCRTGEKHMYVLCVADNCAKYHCDWNVSWYDRLNGQKLNILKCQKVANWHTFIVPLKLHQKCPLITILYLRL